MRTIYTKGIAVVLSVMLIMAFVFLAARKIDPLAFWGVVIVAAVVAYGVMPYLKEK
ncbi:hypothetical protein HZB01_04370 [Candidatus Woesearchaeota archaeon]|nr:hypothetical protein [Candidatus Woesearchaeota archaeon]